MRKFLLFSAALLLTVGLATAQKQRGLHAKKINTVKSASYELRAEDDSIHYDDGTVFTSIGTAEGNFDAGAFIYIPTDTIAAHPDNEVKKLSFYINGVVNTGELRIYESQSAAPVYTQVFTPIDGWNLVNLNVPYSLNPAQSFYIGYFVTTTGGARPLGCDNGPVVAGGNGNWTLYGGNWTHLTALSASLTYNWSIRAFVNEPTPGANAELTGILSPINVEGNCVALSATEEVSVTIKNAGDTEISNFEVSYTINEGTAVIETYTGAIAPGSSVDYTFTQTADLSALGAYVIETTVSVAGDINLYNDVLATTVFSTDATITVDLLTDGFPSESSWEIYNENGFVFGENGALGEIVLNSQDVCVVASGCYSVALYDSFGDGVQDGENFGSLTVYYNEVAVGGFETSEAEFGTEFFVHGIGGGCVIIDAEMTALLTYEYQLTGDVNIEGRLTNVGQVPITSFDVTYNVNSGGESTIYSETGLSIAVGATYDFMHDVAYNFTTEETYDVTLTISNVNGGGETNFDNNVLTSNVTTLSYMPVRKIFGEQATGTWCGWCVRGHVFMEYMNETYPETWIGVAVHNGDPMTNAYYDGQIRNYIGGYPSALVNRGTAFDPSEFEEYYNTEIAKVLPVSVEVTDIAWDAETRQVSFSVSAEFLASMSDVRFNAIIAENNVTGTTTGYRQANYYSGGTYGPMGGYQSLPNPVPAADMVYHNVAREILGTWNGTENSVPATVNAGETHAYQYTYSVSPDYDENEMYIVGLLIDQATGEVLNADKKMFITSNITTTADAAVSIYPNPAKDHINIELAKNAKVQISDISGKIVYTANAKAGNNKINTSNLSGIYFVQISDVDIICVKKLVISK